MKKYFKLMAFAMMAVCSLAFVSCSDDDDKSESASPIVGEWIKDNGHIYYQFKADGTGVYICLADEPGYDPKNPDAVIKNPVYPYPFHYTYSEETRILTTSEECEEHGYDIYEYSVSFSDNNNVLGLKDITYGYDDWEWEYFNRKK